MSRVADSYRTAVATTGPVQATSGAPDEYPELTSLLIGELQGGKEKWARHPYKLLMWCEGSIVMFCFTYRGAKKKLWGSFPSLSEGMDGLEQALAKGNWQWKDEAEDNNGFTHLKK